MPSRKVFVPPQVDLDECAQTSKTFLVLDRDLHHRILTALIN